MISALAMIVIVDERDTVKDGYTAWFDREGVSATGLCPTDFDNWVKSVSEPDILSVEAFLLGDCASRQVFPRLIRGRSRAPVIAMNDTKSLDETLELFAASVDDVVRKPIHVREFLPASRRSAAAPKPSAKAAWSASCAPSPMDGTRKWLAKCCPCRGASGAFWSIW